MHCRRFLAIAALCSQVFSLPSTHALSSNNLASDNDRANPRHGLYTFVQAPESHHVAVRRSIAQAELDKRVDTARYIVLINTTVDHGCPQVRDVLARINLDEQHAAVHQLFNASTLCGFSANLTPDQVTALKAMPDVEAVDKPALVHSTKATSETWHTWGLQRISSSTRVRGDPSALYFNYTYDSTSTLGKGVDVYVLDSGINAQHAAFEGRASNIWPNNSVTDDFGHGTHVAGTIGAAVFGVARGAQLYGLKALDNEGLGTTEDVIAALAYAIRRHVQQASKGASANFCGSVINFSLGIELNGSPYLESAGRLLDHGVRAATAVGMHVVVAAGNDDIDACGSTPSSSGGANGPAITVGATDIYDDVAWFSNIGPCVDVFAPGVNVLSTWIGGAFYITLLSGTSQATPHITGLVAYLMSNFQTLAKSPALMKKYIAQNSLQLNLTSEITWLGDGSERLANNGMLTASP